MDEEEGVTEKVAVKPLVIGDTGKLTRWALAPAGVLTHPVRATALSADMSAPPAGDAALTTEAFREIFWETLFAMSEAVTVMATLPAGVALLVATVKTADPEPPVMELLSKLETIFEFAVEELSETVPAKPFTACTVIVKVADEPAVTDWVVGFADKVNSELLPPLPVDPTVRRGEITQPLATINRLATNNANVRMGESLSSGRSQ
jgi:hypothetical protein